MSVYPQPIINAIVADPNSVMFTSSNLVEIINSGQLSEAQIVTIKEKLKDPRRSEILRILDAEIAAKQKENDFQKISNPGVTLADMNDFLAKYPNTPEAGTVQAMKNELLKQTEETDFANCHDMADYASFIENHSESSFKAQAQEKLEQLKEQFRKEDNAAWNSIGYDMSRLDAYENNRNYILHRGEIETKRAEIENYKNQLAAAQEYKNHIDSMFDNRDSDVDNFVWFIQQHPFLTDYIKEKMLQDMEQNPQRYQRNEMYAIIYGGPLVLRDSGNYEEQQINPIFSENEIINAGILDKQHLNYIKQHPTIQSDNTGQAIPIENNFDVAPNTTDVYFFGVPGCGKSSVIAGLLKTSEVAEGLTFNIIPKLEAFGHKGYNYATILDSYIDRDLFPMSTPKVVQRGGVAVTDDKDDKFIQIIDTELNEINQNQLRKHSISIIEMPGERTLALAAANNAKDVDLLGEGASKLLQNGNNKVFFFVIDPFDTKANTVMLNGSQVKLTQAKTIDCVATLLKNMLIGNKLKNLKAVHIILAKSDLMKKLDKEEKSEETIRNLLSQSAYQQFSNTIKQMCLKNNGEVNRQCNRQPYVFTFSLGKIAAGDFVKYDDIDSKKILKVICANTISVRANNFVDDVMEWMNTSIINK